MKPFKVSKRGKEAFAYFSENPESSQCLKACITLFGIEESPTGYTAEECFYYKETFGGKLLSTSQPVELANTLQGKAFHGITVANCAEDFLGRILFSREIKERYPPWVANEIFQAAKKLALSKLGFIPTFIEKQKDFSEYSKEEIKKIVEEYK